jgi:hypothetical protein
MSGPFPRDKEQVVEPVDDPDAALIRAWDLFGSDYADRREIEPELNRCIDAMVVAGYAEEWGHSPTGSLWRISDAGHDRLAELGRD